MSAEKHSSPKFAKSWNVPQEEQIQNGTGDPRDIPGIAWDLNPSSSASELPIYRQRLIYPPDSILDDYYKFAITQTEGADVYIIGSILAIVAALLARRVYLQWGYERKFPNLFTMLAGRPGDRKTSTINLAKALAKACLPATAFYPKAFSPESLFDEYDSNSGGRPDKIWIDEEANRVLADWKSGPGGERIAARILDLYDCCSLSENYRRNKTDRDSKTRRRIEQTTTSILFGATFSHCCFQKQAVREGMARRFLYYIAEEHGRLIIRPEPGDGGFGHVVGKFKELGTLTGNLDFNPEAASLWECYQKRIRQQGREADRLDEALQGRLASAPMQTLHIAMIFEACRHLKIPAQSRCTYIRPDTLQFAIDHVDECLRAAAFLDNIVNRASIASEADILLEKIRDQYHREARNGSIILTRTDLTSRYCHNSGRNSSLKPDDLYLRLIPALEQQNKARVIRRDGSRPLYAFRVSDICVSGGGGEENAEKEESSPGALSQFSSSSSTSSGSHQDSMNLKPVRGDKIASSTGTTAGGDEGEEKQESAASSPAQIMTLEEFAACRSSGQCQLALDLETYADSKADALDPRSGEIRLISLQWEDSDLVLFDMKHYAVDAQVLKQLLEGQQLIIHNARFDLGFLAEKLGIFPKHIFCTLSASRILTNGDRSMTNDLRTVLSRELGITLPKDQGTSDWGGLFLTEDQLDYAADDVRHLHALRFRQIEQLQAQGLDTIFELEMALIPVIVRMERTGFLVDPQRLKEVLVRTKELLKGPQDELATLFGQNMNLESPEQLKRALSEVGIEVEDTSETTLRALKQPVADLILRYRGLEAQRRQAQTLLDNIRSDGRIHGTLDPLGAETGRFSSRDPNLQNVGRGELRDCFVPGADCNRLIVADYSQVELRVAAYYANDESMLAGFRAGTDLHAQTAAIVLGKNPAAISQADRQLAKAVNFGLLYGQGARGLVNYAQVAYGIELTEVQAADIRARFFNHYKGLAAWHKAAWENAPGLTEGRTRLGRRRLLSPDAPNWQRFMVQINFLVQGSCADALKLAMYYLSQTIPEGAQLVATIHDELIIETPESVAEQVRSTTVKAMCGAFEKLFPGLPIEVQAKICKRWSEK